MKLAIGCAALLALAILGGAAYVAARSGGSPGIGIGQQPSYSVTIASTLPATERVGQLTHGTVVVRNTGSAIAHLILWFQGLESWTIKAISSSCSPRPRALPAFHDGNAWDVGALSSKQQCQITLALDPRVAGTPSVYISTYTATNSRGAPDTGTQVPGGELSWQGTIETART